MSRIISIAITKIDRDARGIAIAAKVVYFDSRGEEVRSEKLPAEMFENVDLDNRQYIELVFTEAKKKNS